MLVLSSLGRCHSLTSTCLFFFRCTPERSGTVWSPLLCDFSLYFILFFSRVPRFHFVLFLSSLSHPLFVVSYRFRTLRTVHASLVVNLQKASCFSGFYVLYLFALSHSWCRFVFDGGWEGGCQSMGQTLAADQPVRRAGSKNCTTIFCHHLEEAFI